MVARQQETNALAIICRFCARAAFQMVTNFAFSQSKTKKFCSKWYGAPKQNTQKDFKWYLVLLKEFKRSLQIIL